MATKKQKLIEFYKETLAALNCSATDDGMITNDTTGEPVVLADGSRLILPTDQGMALFSQGNYTGFHPLSENVIMGQSDTIRMMRVMVNAAITHKVLITMYGLARAVADKVDMTSTQVSKLSPVSGMDSKTVDAIYKLMGTIDHTTPKRLVNVFLKRGGSIGDNTYKRTAFVSFPLHDELVTAVDGNRDDVYGVTMRKKDVQVILKLFELLIEHAGEKDYYSFGSNSKACPYFHALLNAYANVIRDLNGITWTFRKVLSSTVTEEPHVKLDFVEEFGEGGQHRNVIPPLDGNQGTKVEGENEYDSPEPEPVVQPEQQVGQQQQAIPAQPVQPQAVQPTVNTQQQYQPPQQYMQPMYNQQQAPTGYAQPAPKVSSKIPKIGADRPPADKITHDGHAAQKKSYGGTKSSTGHVIETAADMYATAYPQTLFPRPQPAMMQSQYPVFPRNGGPYTPPANFQPQTSVPMMAGQGYPQPQYNGYGQPQAFAQPMGFPNNQQMMQPQQPSNYRGGYPVFPKS